MLHICWYFFKYLPNLKTQGKKVKFWEFTKKLWSKMAKFIERRNRVWFYRNVWPKLLKNKLKRCMKMILRFEFSKKTSVQISGCCKHCWECQVLHMPIAQGMYIKILKMKIAPVNIMFRVPLSFILLGLWTRRKCYYSNCSILLPRRPFYKPCSFNKQWKCTHNTKSSVKFRCRSKWKAAKHNLHHPLQ